VCYINNVTQRNVSYGQNNHSYQILRFLNLLHNDCSALCYITSYNGLYNGFFKTLLYIYKLFRFIFIILFFLGRLRNYLSHQLFQFKRGMH